MIFLCLDPGWSSAVNTPFRRHKTWTHEGGIATPFIFHWPRAVKQAGRIRQVPVHIIDIAPTLFEIAAGKPLQNWRLLGGPELPGRSLVPLLHSGSAGSFSTRSFWWLHEGNRALRSGHWKLVAAGAAAPWELYDLRGDRGESLNLAGQHPHRVRQMRELWEKLSHTFF